MKPCSTYVYVKLFLPLVKPKNICPWACHEGIREGVVIAAFILIFFTRYRWVVSLRLHFYLWGIGPVTRGVGDWMDPWTSLFALVHRRISCLCWDPKHSISVFHPVDQSLYRLRYSCFFTVDTSIGDLMTDVFFVCIYLIFLQQGFVFILFFLFILSAPCTEHVFASFCCTVNFLVCVCKIAVYSAQICNNPLRSLL